MHGKAQHFIIILLRLCPQTLSGPHLYGAGDRYPVKASYSPYRTKEQSGDKELSYLYI
jgi:hypothetical protein